MTATRPSRDASRTARSCVRSSSGRFNSTRTPRSPRNGLSSRGSGREGSGFVTPDARVPSDKERPEVARAFTIVVLRFRLGGRGRAMQEEKLGSQQADAVGSETDTLLGVGEAAD